MKASDYIVLQKKVYGGVYQLLTEFLEGYSTEAPFVEESKDESWKKVIQSNTIDFYIETTSNPQLTITD